MIFHDFTKVKMILWSIHTFWYKGLAKIKETNRVWKKGLFLSKIAAQVRRHIFRKSFYLSDLVYWVGFVIGVLFKTHLSNANFIDFLTLLWKIVFSSELLFFITEVFFFKLVIFHCFLPNPYTRICVSTIESLSLFCEIVKNHGKLPVRSWVFGFSLIFDFSAYFNYS